MCLQPQNSYGGATQHQTENLSQTGWKLRTPPKVVLGPPLLHRGTRMFTHTKIMKYIRFPEIAVCRNCGEEADSQVRLHDGVGILFF